MNPLAALSVDRTPLVGETYRPHVGLFYPGIRPPSEKLPLGYDLALLDGQKSGLTRPPVLQKPMVVPTAAGDGLGLDQQSEPGLNGTGGFLRLPWISPYADATMYPFLDLAWQPSPFLHQQLVYQSLCAAGAGGSTPGDHGLVYLPRYAQTHLPPLGPPIRFTAATPGSTLTPGPDPALQGVSPHQEQSAFSTSPPTHQEAEPQAVHVTRRQHGDGKSNQFSFSKNTPSRNSRGGSDAPVSSSGSDLFRSTPSSSHSGSHTFNISRLNSDPGTAIRSGSNQTKDVICSSERTSPAKTPEDKPSDLRAKELQELSNGFPAPLETLNTLGYLPQASYGLLKDGLPSPVSTHTKTPDCPEAIRSLSSPWVDNVPNHSPGSTSTPGPGPTSGGRPSASSASPRATPFHLEKVDPNSKGESRISSEKQRNLHQQESAERNGNSSSPGFGDSYLPPGLGYTNRYIPYAVAENMSLQRAPVPGKGSAYPHTFLLGIGSFCPSRLVQEHGLPFGVHPKKGDFMAYQNTKVPLPPEPSHSGLDRLETRTRRAERHRNQDCSHVKRDKSKNQTVKASSRTLTAAREDFIIDLVHDDDQSSTIREDSTKTGVRSGNHTQERPPWSSEDLHPKQAVEQRRGELDQTPQPGPPLQICQEILEEPLSPFSDLTEEQTMRCARTSPHQFSRKCKPGASGGDSVIRVTSEQDNGLKTLETSADSNVKSDPTSSRDDDPLGEQNSKNIMGAECKVNNQNNPADGGNCPLDSPVSSRTGSAWSSLNPRAPAGMVKTNREFVCGNPNPRRSPSTNEDKSLRTPTCEPRVFINPRLPDPENHNPLNSGGGNFNLRDPACSDAESNPSKRNNQTSVNHLWVPTSGNPPNPDFNGMPADLTSDLRAECLSSREIEPPSSGDGEREIQDSLDLQTDEDEGPGCSMTRRSGLTKRIANSSGFVGDRFHCVTTELNADSSKLSREQRALQRAMLRFSELELKENEEGGGGEEDEEEKVMMTAVDSQQRDAGRGEEEEKSEGGGGRTPYAAAAEAATNEEENKEEEGGGLQEEMKKEERQTDLSPGRGLSPGLSGSDFRRRIFSLEPFHQSSITSSRLKRGREEEQEDKETDSTPEDVKKLKVCIELNGLRLNKPRLPGELNQWLLPSQRSVEPDRKFRMDVPGIRAPNRGWSDPMTTKRDDPRVFPPTSTAHLPMQPFSPALLASSRLQDKHQRLKESRRSSTFLPTLPPLPPSSSASFSPFCCRDNNDHSEPKGKRPCKMKHTGGERASDEEQEERKASLSCSPSPCPLSPQHTQPARPLPPGARRLIVNKNAGETLLQRAARLGYEEVVLYCLEQQVCDVNHRDNAGYCALHEACARGWLGIVRHLVEHGADTNCSAQDGTRPLHDAVENDHVEVVRFLLACGADPTLTSYSGRGPLNMTHSATMETFLEDYLSDLQGRSEGDPGIYWEFYGGSVCEPSTESPVVNVLADPPGPDQEGDDEEEGEDEDERVRREVFEFELSDRPLLPCYNIQVEESQGPRNWLLLCDVLGRLRITSRSFRRLFPQLNVQSIPEDRFYQQASLSQLLTGPDQQELSPFRPHVKDPLELVEATPELAGMLGSSMELVDSRRDSTEASPPPTPPPLPSPPPHRQAVSAANANRALQNRTPGSAPRRGLQDPAAGWETNMWDHHGSHSAHLDSKTDSGRGEQQRTWIPKSAHLDSKIDWSVSEQRQKLSDDTKDNAVNPDSNVDFHKSEQPETRDAGNPSCAKPDQSEPQEKLCEDSGNANSAKGNANTAKGNANSANGNANSAKGNANTTKGNANTANGNANSANGNANTAHGNANSANGSTNTANGNANTANGSANTANGNANSANGNANSANGNANSANGNANTANGNANSANGNANSAYLDSVMWDQHQGGKKSRGKISLQSKRAIGANMWEPQRLRSRSSVNSNIKVDAVTPRPQQIENKNTPLSVKSNSCVDANTTSEVSGSSAGINVSTEANRWEPQGIKRVGGANTAPPCCIPGQGGKMMKMDAAWQRNLANVRVHIRDVGVKVGGGNIWKDSKTEQSDVCKSGRSWRGARVNSVQAEK